MLLIFIAGLLTAFLSPLIFRSLEHRAGAVLSILPLLIFGYCCTFLPAVTQGETIVISHSWVPQLGIDIVFLVDGLSLFFALLISGFGVIIILYASGYLKGHHHLGRFYFYLILFIMSMLGIVLSGNLISLFVFWELTSLSSYLLISFDHEKGTSRTAALHAMLVTVGGGLVMLAGFILLGLVGNTFYIPALLNNHDLIVSSPQYSLLVVFILIGAFTKSAQFPFHFWLPNAMAAPTPVSAYLHSATMVKAGVFLVARLNPALGETMLWETTLMLVGGATMVIGAVMSLRFTDLKKILAYTTISALGTLFMMFGVGTPYAVQAAVIFILAHALYKGTLFMMAGNLDHYAGSRDILELSGLRRQMPYTAFAAVLACLSMSGVVPFLGFIGKELVYEAALNATLFNIILLSGVFFSSAIGTAIALKIGYGVFFGPLNSPTQPAKEASWLMLAGPLAAGVGGLLLGIMPHWLTQPLLNIAMVQIMKDIEVLTLSLWHGFNLVLALSVLTLLVGFLLFRFRTRLTRWTAALIVPEDFGPTRMFDKTIKGILQLSYRATLFTQNGFLRYYLATIVWAFVSLLLFVLVSNHMVLRIEPKILSLLDFSFYEEIISLFIVMGAVKIFYTHSRVTALASMGVVGYGLALIYIVFSAPDTAMTQFLIETLTVVLFVLVLHKLPYFEELSEKLRRYAYLVLSVVFGGTMTYILLLVKSYPMHSELKTFFGENSVAQGYGRNIVNVILVDFRALDTLGEAVVLGIAAIGIYTLLKLKLGKQDVLS